jgi:hypothetical protein
MMQLKERQPFTGTAGVPPAMSATREKGLGKATSKAFAPAARCGRDARGPSKCVAWLIPRKGHQYGRMASG